MDSAKSVKFTIYCHTHTESGRRYIGLTKLTMMKRWNSHVYTANRVKDSKPAVTSHFANAIRKYGKDAFTHEVLETCYDLESANASEQKWVDHFKTRDPQFGFNISPGGPYIPHPIRDPTDRPIRNPLDRPKFTIYCHIHSESGRRYIGLTKKTMLFRWNQHVSNAKAKRGKGCEYFWNAIRKYGKDAFTHEVLEVCDTIESANAAEQKWIDHFKTRDPQFGFNLKRGGDHTPHPIRRLWDRPEYREKALAGLAKANAVSREVRVQRTNKLWQDPDFRKQISEVLRNNMSDPVIKERVMRGMRASLATPDSIIKRSKISKRMWQSDDYRKRNAELWQDPDFRERCESGLRHGASLNASKTHCPHGHEYSPENTIINAKGSRECLECSRKSIRESARKISAEKKRIRGPIIVTHCINGHEYSPENVRIAKRGSRICLACMRKRSRERARMLRQQARSQPLI